MQVIPEFLRERKGQTITSNTDTAFQKAFNTNLSAFEWMDQHPANLQSLSHFMAMRQDNNWTDQFPVTAEFASAPPQPTDVALIDIGGGYGHQALLFRQKYPQLGSVVVQEIPTVLDRLPPASEADGLEFHVHDFFQTQTLRAKFYYMRHVLHDWNDADCVRILKATIPAMASYSRIVIDEVVLPDTQVPWQAAWLDMVMNTALGGAERTRTEWEVLLGQAGLRIVDIVQYDNKTQSAIVAVPA